MIASNIIEETGIAGVCWAAGQVQVHLAEFAVADVTIFSAGP
jgi:hypothetical protein